MNSFLALLICLLLTASTASAQTKPVRVVWDPPIPEDVPHVDGYNVYQVSITPPIKPADYAVNIPTPLPDGHSLTLMKLNTTPIPAGTQEFVIKNATPGMQAVVAAFNTTWGDGPISDVLTLRPLPPKPPGLKAVALLIEASRDLITWAPLAVIEAALGRDEYFRLDVRK